MSPKKRETGSDLRVRGLRSAIAGPFDLDLAAGQCAVVEGPSGSGKSLFLRMIADLDPCEGEVALGGLPRESRSGPEWRRLVPYVAADSGWWLDKVSDHFDRSQRVTGFALAERLGLTDGQFHGPVLRLSTGERQRLALIRALVMDSPVLLLDEPTGALDGASTAAVEALLKDRLAAGVSILVVSHDTGLAERLGPTIRIQVLDRKLRRPE